MGKIVLEGLAIFFFADDMAGMAFYALRGLPWSITFSLFAIKWLLGLLVIFYGTGRILTWLKQHRAHGAAKERLKDSREDRWVNYPKRKQEELKLKITEWLSQRKKWIIILAFLPIPVPYLGALIGVAIIALVRAMEIKYGLFFLVLTTVLKALLLCSFIYYLVPWP